MRTRQQVEFTAVAGTTYRIEVGGAEGGRVLLHLVSAESKLRLLTLRTGGSGAGAVRSSVAGIDCGATCRYDLAAGTSVTLVAEPAPGSAFDGWSGGGCSGAGACTVAFHSDATVVATFGPAGATTPRRRRLHREPRRLRQAPSRRCGTGGPAEAACVCHKGFKKVTQHGKARCVKKKAPPKKHHRSAEHRG